MLCRVWYLFLAFRNPLPTAALAASLSSFMASALDCWLRVCQLCLRRLGTSLDLHWRGRSAFTKSRARHLSSGPHRRWHKEKCPLTQGLEHCSSSGAGHPSTAVHCQLPGWGPVSCRVLLLQTRSDAPSQTEQEHQEAAMQELRRAPQTR